MVLVTFDLEGQKRSMYMDGNLYRQLTTRIQPKVHKKDFDQVFIVDGPEGSGKSVFAMQVAKVLDPDFALEQICFSSEDFVKAIIRSKKGNAIIYDEAFTGLSSRGALSEVNRLLVSLMMEMRQKNLFVIVVMPTFFELDRYVALFRTIGLFHIYLKRGERGRWLAYNRKTKKYLYFLGKKFYDYSKPKSNFFGRFTDVYTVNREEYIRKKRDYLMKKSRSTKAETWHHQRDVLFYIMHKDLGFSTRKISDMCKKRLFKINQRTITDIINEIARIFVIQALKEEEIGDVPEKVGRGEGENKVLILSSMGKGGEGGSVRENIKEKAQSPPKQHVPPVFLPKIA